MAVEPHVPADLHVARPVERLELQLTPCHLPRGKRPPGRLRFAAVPPFDLPGRTIDVPVRVSRRARRARIVVDPSRAVEIVLPLRAPRGTAERLLVQHRGWLERQLLKPPPEFELGLQRDDVVWLGGDARPRPQARDLARWYREQARVLVTRTVEREGARLRVTHRSLAIRDQRTRWASCSAKGALSFNWRLVLAPPDVLTYVVVHELCHRRRHDHSPAFWRLVEEAWPGHRAQRAWLDRHGPELLAYRPPR
jgi:predicted metal-dependent hydrolase